MRKGGEVGNREQGKRPTRTSPYFVTPRSDCSRIKYQSHARFDEETIVDASDVGCLKLEKKKKKNLNELFDMFLFFNSRVM